MTLRVTCLLSAALALSVAACGESTSAPAASKPAATGQAPAKPAAPAAAPAAAPVAAPAANPVAAATATVQSAVAAWQAEAAKADKSTLDQVIADCKALIATKEADFNALSDQITAKAGELATFALGGGGSSDAIKAELDRLKQQLAGLKQELAGLNDKLAVFVAELAKRPA